ncbi:glyoxylase-like metal-dependent hydrolase (beta-lactamase superfamily II) [Paucibacter oligotrophus]|uniref:Glyoxylase-like metal-dependent hydrolase (Beta-lactamase superfamily II) n=1 Tax=Roseateles oligotrophus TaxID=1769250 RepID=A0A840LAB2_9BURK|nr:MBL fold metallo-hydrolase [Roseateles oligotrophus]MBB4845514.1 glyoxylase-like metal-dependent hydrolase (beta-lactamase superfamily II) [Roseateles oligotrophus]
MSSIPTLGQASLLPPDITLLERGWLSSNSLLLHDENQGAVLVDSGYGSHQEQTLALVQHALSPRPQPSLRLIANTHLHSDHCGGNALLSQRFGCEIAIPPGEFDAALNWDQQKLSYESTGQQCPRFKPDQILHPGSLIKQGERQWQVMAAPGHDPHSVILFEPESGVLVSADALWEHGFGIVFPAIKGEELAAEQGFAEVEASLDLIASLPARLVIPGHGPAFNDLAGALQRAHKKLDYFRKNPMRHARHAAKALIMFRLLEVGSQPRHSFVDGLIKTPVHQALWRAYFSRLDTGAWTEELLTELSHHGALKLSPEMELSAC